ncbi:hypothetical protein A1QO_08860 [Vibrio genomosp. F10 str. ZF-129]|uniref:Integrase n=1 Tax=Vibrio genomosp. F10 str. ZF-129 TaxID=1187848 RepID=A0A1E5BEH4_9VIBR|nr:hypothetical protein [Vibrio genomosp. F10]OEE33945.1 hypothetical protein A1QO_08860 [Vibrio genomosp. F10 str. ZF-129]
MDNLRATQENISFVDSNVESNLNKSFPSVCELNDALTTKDYGKLSNMTVIPGKMELPSIKFSDDSWTNQHLTNEDETYRKANFNGITEKLKVEVKIVGIYLLWFSPKKAKLSSVIRIIENLILVAKVLMKSNISSLFSLDRAPIRQQFMSEFNEGRTSGTIDNYYKSLSRIADMKHSVFGQHNFYLKTNFLFLSPGRTKNQTYCMPMSILNAYWSSYINHFNNFSVNNDNWSYLCNLLPRYSDYLTKNNLKKHNNNWLYFIDEFCQERLQQIANDNRCATKKIVIVRSDESVNDYNNKCYTYKSLNNGKLIDTQLKTYNRRYPKYLVDIEDIYNFFNQLALLATETIQAMTGIRKSEMVSLKFGSLIEEQDWVGINTTLHKHADEGGVEQIWAGAPFIKTIFDKIKPIAQVIFKVTNQELDSLYIKTDARHFYSTNQFRLMKTQRNSENLLDWTSKHEIVLTREDIEEFWSLNPNLSDRLKVEQEIYIGGKWPITSHQYRRSIAVHVRRLELVTSNQLLVQLKHIAKSVTEWYSDGFISNSKTIAKLADSFAKELENADLERSATIAMQFQNGSNLFGKGGASIESQRNNPIKSKIYQSFEHAKSLAKRKKSKIMSLGNGMYCMNGLDCEYKSITQAANCNPDCENLVADKSSIPIWLKRYEKYRALLKQAKDSNQPTASIEFLRLELETYKQALDFYEVTYE